MSNWNLKLNVDKIDDLEQLVAWKSTLIKRLIVAVKRKDSKKLETFLAVKGYSVKDSYFE